MSLRVGTRPMSRSAMAKFGYRKSHTILGSTGAPTYLPIWETEDYAWSAMAPGSPRVLRSPTTGEPVKHNGKYWMTYTAVQLGAVDGIALANSDDLIHWEDVGGNPIIAQTDPDAQAWEQANIITCDFIYMGDEPGHSYDFWIFYGGADQPAATQTAVGVIKSNDMTTWARDLAHNPIADWIPGWVINALGPEDFSVQKTSTGSWMAIYECNTEPTAGATNGFASSDDPLPHSGWVDRGQMCSGTFGGDFIANPVVIRRTIDDVDYYYAYYEYKALGVIHIYGMYAEESDIFTTDAWTQMTNPVLSPTEAWEGNIEIPNGLIWFNNRFYVYYVGNVGVNKKIGLALGTNDIATGSMPWEQGNRPIAKYADNIIDYQMRMTVHYGAGVDVGTHVYLNGRCRPDFGDIRFAYGLTKLSYWIQEQVDSNYAIFWIKIPFTFLNPETIIIHIYYGRREALTTESGADTFIEFEDWESYDVGATLPLGLFEASNIEEVCRVDNNRAFKGSKSLYVDDDSAVQSNYMTWNYADKTEGGFRFLMTLYKETDYGAAVAGAFHWHRIAAEIGVSLRFEGPIPAEDVEEYRLPGPAWFDIVGADLTAGAWHILEICAQIDAATWDFRFDNAWYLDRAKRENLDQFIYTRIFLGGVASMIRGNLGVCAIGKYIDPDPSHGAWGSEEKVVWPF